MIRTEAAIALMCGGALLGFVAGATIAREDTPRRTVSAPQAWPLEVHSTNCVVKMRGDGWSAEAKPE